MGTQTPSRPGPADGFQWPISSRQYLQMSRCSSLKMSNQPVPRGEGTNMMFSNSKSATHWRITLLTLGATCALQAVAADPQPATTKGFVVTRFVTAMYEGPTGRTAAWDKSDGLPECPEGFADPIDVDGI